MAACIGIGKEMSLLEGVQRLHVPPPWHDGKALEFLTAMADMVFYMSPATLKRRYQRSSPAPYPGTRSQRVSFEAPGWGSAIIYIPPPLTRYTPSRPPCDAITKVSSSPGTRNGEPLAYQEPEPRKGVAPATSPRRGVHEGRRTETRGWDISGGMGGWAPVLKRDTGMSMRRVRPNATTRRSPVPVETRTLRPPS